MTLQQITHLMSENATISVVPEKSLRDLHPLLSFAFVSQLHGTVLSSTRCTPLEKIATLSSSTQRLTAHVRDRLDAWTAAPKIGSGSDTGDESSSGGPAEFEFMCRTGGGAWITARQAQARQSLAAFEHTASMPEVAAHVHKLYDAVASGCYAGLG